MSIGGSVYNKISLINSIMIYENMIVRKNAARLLAILVILLLYIYTRLPALDQQQRLKIAQRFNFSQVPLPETKGYIKKYIRAVNPSLEGHSAWISSVGASVALNDLDDDGLANDLCHVDTRIDQVLVAPVPGTGERYPIQVLSPEPLPYDYETMAPMGCLPADLNEDGHMDLTVYYWGRTPIIFLRTNKGYKRQELVSYNARWFTNAATSADLDGDGHIDLIFANYFQDGASVLDTKSTQPVEMQHSMSRAFNGGGTHFFLWKHANKTSSPTAEFVEINNLVSSEVNNAWTLALGASDLDGDLLPELYFANDFGPDRLLHNRSIPGKLSFALLEGERDFTMPASKVLGKDSFKGMGVDFADLNGDLIPDLFVSNIASEYALEESHFMFISTGNKEAMKKGIAPYKDHSEAMGVSRSNWSWDTKFADFDNDGIPEVLQATGFLKGEVDRWPELQELAIGNDENMTKDWAWPHFKAGDDLSGHTHNPFYVMADKSRYYDLSADIGIDQNYVSRGIAVADVDGDGDQDFAVANQWEPSFLYRNNCPNCNNFIGLHLRFAIDRNKTLAVSPYAGHPVGLSRPAVGASAELLFPDGHSLIAQVDGGNGHSGRRSPDLHFGLGKGHPDQIYQIRLRWRDHEGKVHTDKIKLKAGWHTVELAT